MTRPGTADPTQTVPTPRENAFFIGHEAAEAEILEAYASRRFPHAWLICGPRGIGKATLAYRMARLLLSPGSSQDGLFSDSEKVVTLDMSRDNPVFRQIAALGHPDLKCLERRPDEKKQGRLRNEILVDASREVGSFLTLTAACGGWRVVVIDAVDDMNRNAANALLKPLEDPPKKTALILVSHNPGRLLPTLRSRCRRLNLKPLDDGVMKKLITRYLPDTPAEAADELMRVSQGSIGHAVSLAEGEGIEVFESIVALLDGLPDMDTKKLEQLLGRVAKSAQNEAFHIVIQSISRWAGEQIKLALGQGRDLSGLDRRLEVWENLDGLLGRAVGLDLDRKQVIVNALLTAQAMARASAD